MPIKNFSIELHSLFHTTLKAKTKDEVTAFLSVPGNPKSIFFPV
ncbi:Hypothetical protein Minf_1648 [Methylacidiphilum infernorum V4]|uniref:Uncharacterized protein n=1 Tax=Methylacidiphilum infernorum (isolate V4) TaxID=481448 RepID=B3DWN9_METI4|nr:Hypothetical protein Minf_1648 [Methylacidiphilum infernorum V4]